ncbi:MAG: alpha/beta fold hydrolase [Promethearchaeota archaeon]|jgi:pimeloyl-ACP methyl ester carboxylesterase
MKKQTIQVGNNKIAICESEGEGQDVLLIHGNSLSSKSFTKQLEGSVGLKYHIFALDLPGHGDSSPFEDPRNFYNLPGYASVVAELIQHLNLSKLVLVGHSLGGHIALEVSEISSEVIGIIIFGTPPLGIPPEINQAFLDHRLEPSLLILEGAEIPQIFIDDFNNTDPNARKFLIRNTAKNNFKDELEIVKNMKIPLAIIHGAQDRVINLNYINDVYVPTLWKNEIQVIDNVGHSPQWESPNVFNSILEGFLKGVN